MTRNETQRHFEDLAGDYYRRNYQQPRSRHERGLALRRALCLELIDPEHDAILDLGCGPGALAVPLSRDGRAVVALDLAPRMVVEARRLVEAMGVGERSQFCVADATALPFGRDTFDAVVTTGVLEYVPDTTKALREIVRVLKPNGALIATASLPRTLERTVMRYIGSFAMRLKYRDAIPGGAEPFHRSFAASEFDSLVEDAGLRVQRRSFSYFAPFPVDAMFPSLVTLVDHAIGDQLQQVDFARRRAKTYIVKATKQ